MSLAYRPLVAEVAQDAIAEWLRRSTGLKIWLAESGLPRPALPFIGFEFPRDRPFTGAITTTQKTETIGETTITITALEGAACTLRLNAARVALAREVGEPIEEFALRLRAEAAYWLRGRATATAVGDTLTIVPLQPGLLHFAQAIEGATLESEIGPPRQLSQRLYQALCRIEIQGARLAGARPGEVGDGLDTFTIEAACVEGLGKPAIRQMLRGAYLKAVAQPTELVPSGSVVSGARREVRAYFDLAFGWTGFFTDEPSAIESIELELFSGSDSLGTIIAE